MTDLRIAVRKLRQSPGFLTLALLSLALGIGANTTVFSLLDAVLLRPLPVAEPERLVALYSSKAESLYRSSTYADFVDYQNPEVFSGLAAYAAWELSLATDDESRLLSGELVSPNYFDVLGVPPVLGNGLAASSPESPLPIAVIGHALWQRAFGGDPRIVGRPVRLSGHPFTIAGVAPPGFRGPSLAARSEIWLPFGNYQQVATGFWSHFEAVSYAAQRQSGRRIALWYLIGRLRPAVTLDQARAALAARDQALGEQFPDTHGEQFASLEPAVRAATPLDERGDATRFAMLLVAAVAIALLIACSNVANLLLARADGRRQEMGIRLAVGAGRARLLRQLMTESLVLAALGAAAGLLVATWAFDLLAPFRLPGDITIGELDLAIDGRILAFNLAAALLTGLLFGLAPAFQTSRHDPATALQRRAGGAGPNSRRFRSTLIVAQVGLTLLLLVAAGLFVRSLHRALATELGFEPRGVLTMTFDLGLERYGETRAEAFYADLLERVRAMPDVRSASVTSTPFGQLGVGVGGLTIEGRGRFETDRITLSRVGADYFDILGIRLASGRGFDARDRAGGPKTLIVNESLARTLWPGQSPIGQRIHFADKGDSFFEIVGVAADSRYFGVAEEPQLYVYMPMTQHWSHAAGNPTTLLVRTTGQPTRAVKPIADLASALDPQVPVAEVSSLADRIAETLMPQRMGAAFLGFFAALALILAATGIFGAVACSATRRTREIGLRMALGARPAAVARLFLRQGLAPVATGVLLGLAAAAALTRLLQAFLFEVAPIDPTTFAAATALLVGVAALACWLPARTAARLDPTEALRQD